MKKILSKWDNLEIRYWVIKVSCLTREPDLLELMKRDSLFCTLLTNRSYCFKEDQAECGLLRTNLYNSSDLVKGNRTSIEKEIEDS
jgi:hypothetical protein